MRKKCQRNSSTNRSSCTSRSSSSSSSNTRWKWWRIEEGEGNIGERGERRGEERSLSAQEQKRVALGRGHQDGEAIDAAYHQAKHNPCYPNHPIFIRLLIPESLVFKNLFSFYWSKKNKIHSQYLTKCSSYFKKLNLFIL